MGVETCIGSNRMRLSMALTLYEDAGFGGYAETFYFNAFDLDDYSMSLFSD